MEEILWMEDITNIYNPYRWIIYNPIWIIYGLYMGII